MNRYWVPGGDVDIERVALAVARDSFMMPTATARQHHMHVTMRDLEAEMRSWGELSRNEIATALFFFAGDVNREIQRLRRVSAVA
jgi:hypothetical protein